jgi:hypothetical protein
MLLNLTAVVVYFKFIGDQKAVFELLSQQNFEKRRQR